MGASIYSLSAFWKGLSLGKVDFSEHIAAEEQEPLGAP